MPAIPLICSPWYDVEHLFEVGRDYLVAQDGEEMARHWLDVARYADTHGLHLDNERQAWGYRDYVISAFNGDKPFDAFIREQIAGDLLPSPRINPIEQIIESRIGPMFYQLGEKRHGDSSEFEGYLVRAAELSATQPDRARRLAAAAYIGANVSGMLEGSRELLEQVFPLDGLSPIADSYFLAAAPFFGDVLTVPKPLVSYRTMKSPPTSSTSISPDPSSMSMSPPTL